MSSCSTSRWRHSTRPGVPFSTSLVQDLRDRFDLLTLIVTHDLGVINQYATHAYYLNQTIRAGGPVSQLAADPQTAPYFAALDEEI